jgi:MFS superfamily sulfate permease-like transporter
LLTNLIKRKTKQIGEQIFYLRGEPYLTFLNIPQLERQGADIQSKVEELEELNQSLRNRDKVKDDAIAQLSDQLMALSTRLQEIERRQQLVFVAADLYMERFLPWSL